MRMTSRRKWWLLLVCNCYITTVDEMERGMWEEEDWWEWKIQSKQYRIKCTHNGTWRLIILAVYTIRVISHPFYHSHHQQRSLVHSLPPLLVSIISFHFMLLLLLLLLNDSPYKVASWNWRDVIFLSFDLSCGIYLQKSNNFDEWICQLPTWQFDIWWHRQSDELIY
jgi:hypothetical protein